MSTKPREAWVLLALLLSALISDCVQCIQIQPTSHSSRALRSATQWACTDRRLDAAFKLIASSSKPRDVRSATTALLTEIEVSTADSDTLELLFAALRAVGGAKKAIALLRHCKQQGIMPSARCYNYAMEACLKFGYLQDAYQIQHCMLLQSIPLSMTAAVRLWLTGSCSDDILRCAMNEKAISLLIQKQQQPVVPELIISSSSSSSSKHASTASEQPTAAAAVVRKPHARRHRSAARRSRSRSALGKGHLPAVLALLESMARHPSGALDLHGFTAAQAKCGVAALLADAQYAGGQSPLRDWSVPLLLITGRGNNSQGGVPGACSNSHFYQYSECSACEYVQHKQCMSCSSC
jgi:DNA-nicking Smr family endonuclease